MNKVARFFSASLVAALACTLFFACSTGSGGSDDNPDAFAITILPNGAANGELVAANVAKAAKDATITLTASLGAGRRVALTADGVAITPATISADEGMATFTMPGKAVVVTATFSDIPATLYAITVTPIDAKSGEFVTASVSEAREGTTITLTASFGPGRWVDLSADGIVIGPSIISVFGDTATFIMPGSAVTVTARFYSVYPITVTPIGGTGSEGVIANVTTAAKGTSISLTASLGTGRRVTLSADGVVIAPTTISTSGGTATFAMPGAAVDVTATFSNILYPITIKPIGATGSDAITSSVTTAAFGAPITLTAVLGPGRRVALSASGVTITPATISTNGDKQAFTMPAAAVSISATFSNITPGYAQTHVVNGVSFDTHYTPYGGPFTMAAPGEPATQTVTLTRNFWMGETEVTQGLWEAVWGLTWPGPAPTSSYGIGANKPAYFLDWYDAVTFCNLLTEADRSIPNSERVYYSDAGLTTAYTKEDAASNSAVYADLSKKGYRLPTEAEWEHAARYIDDTSWNHGNHVSGDTEHACYDAASCTHTLASDVRISEYVWWEGNNGASGTPEYGVKDVGQKAANALGLRDMSGNLLEWCHDWYAAYSGGSISDPTGPTSGSERVVRGAAWYSGASAMRCSRRVEADPEENDYYGYGFRLCRTAD